MRRRPGLSMKAKLMRRKAMNTDEMPRTSHHGQHGFVKL